MDCNAINNLNISSLIIKIPANNAGYIAWYLSSINASDVFGIPTFGFIINATSYYQNPNNNLSCNG
ncbi:hypothetical protein JCM14467A_14590 [Vulcanisaeta sp. JCM 14467]